jgi:hypothetical protein
VTDSHTTMALTLLNITDATYDIHWYKGTTALHHFTNQTTLRLPNAAKATTVPEWYTAEVELSLPQIRLKGRKEMREQVKIWFQGCD